MFSCKLQLKDNFLRYSIPLALKTYLISYWFLEYGISEDSGFFQNESNWTPINLESFGTFRGPLFHKPVTGNVLFFG